MALKYKKLLLLFTTFSYPLQASDTFHEDPGFDDERPSNLTESKFDLMSKKWKLK